MCEMSEMEIIVEYYIFLFLDFTFQFNKYYLKGLLSVPTKFLLEILLSRGISKSEKINESSTLIYPSAISDTCRVEIQLVFFFLFEKQHVTHSQL